MVEKDKEMIKKGHELAKIKEKTQKQEVELELEVRTLKDEVNRL